ncbi:hypothetical protein GmHk_18G052104 [Glycine max]|nr:hypothetical protein GmHk_18G052104 [Glycine max]
MIIILPKENVVIWFCSLHNRPDNYLKRIINSVLKELDNTTQSKSNVTARWIVVKTNLYLTVIDKKEALSVVSRIIRKRPLEPKRLKALRIQWAKYYLKVKNET